MDGKHSNGTARIEAYLNNGETLYFSFQTITSLEVRKWVNAINNIIYQTLNGSNTQNTGYNPESYAIPGAAMVAETLKGTIDTFKDVFSRKSNSDIRNLQMSGKCPGCGSTLVGLKGQSVKCPYCDTIHHF